MLFVEKHSIFYATGEEPKLPRNDIQKQGRILMLPVDCIEPSPYQARTAFDEPEIAALAVSICRTAFCSHQRAAGRAAQIPACGGGAAAAGLLVPDFIYNIGTTMLNGDILMLIFFFVNKIIFRRGKQKSIGIISGIVRKSLAVRQGDEKIKLYFCMKRCG